eukprot:1211037-Prymnesium_polylepis.1
MSVSRSAHRTPHTQPPAILLQGSTQQGKESDSPLAFRCALAFRRFEPARRTATAGPADAPGRSREVMSLGRERVSTSGLGSNDVMHGSACGG